MGAFAGFGPEFSLLYYAEAIKAIRTGIGDINTKQSIQDFSILYFSAPATVARPSSFDPGVMAFGTRQCGRSVYASLVRGTPGSREIAIAYRDLLYGDDLYGDDLYGDDLYGDDLYGDDLDDFDDY